MKKKFFVVMILAAGFAVEVFAQQVQRVTYTEMRPDGTVGRTVTVDAVFIDWLQQRFTLEGNFLVVHSTIRPVDGEWSAWELSSRQPTSTTLRHLFDEAVRHHSSHPRSSLIFPIRGTQTIRIRTTPDGHSSPMWWRNDGRAFYIFFRRYAIL